MKEKYIILLAKTKPWRLNRQGFYNLKYYFFGSVAFKINAKKPAGINPVVSNNLNLIPEQIEEIMIVSKELLNKHDKELSSCTPPSLSASFIYYYIYKNAINITKKKISEETNISIVTIQKIVNILLKIDVQPKCD